jgi:hypothetical protein
MYSPDDYSDDSSWDSEIDGPCSLDSGMSSDEDERRMLHSERHQTRYVWYNGARYPYVEDEDEFERDPWNAVAVVGLRVFSKDNAGVTIEVVNSETERKKEGDDASIISISTVRRKHKELDVDDSAADATSPMRTRTSGLDDELKTRSKEEEAISHVGTAPAGNERNRQGTLS